MVFSESNVGSRNQPYNRENVLISDYIETLVKKVERIPYDKNSVPQEQLDLTDKVRTSLFPWRGQFSPELVEMLLSRYARDGYTIFDPFVGSGTTLFEAARKGFQCYGADINPSAIEMARTAELTSLSLQQRRAAMQDVKKLILRYCRPTTWDLFSYLDYQSEAIQERENHQELLLNDLIREVADQPIVHNLLVNIIMRYMNYKTPHIETDLMRAWHEHSAIVESIPYSNKECRVFHCDARSIPLPENSINLIITSPPYINVFNYHQNNRSAMEILGWDLLDVAKSEIGSNRKHRSNRFLTVIQYALDMLDALKEMHRLLRSDGKAIIIVGRESSVRGVKLRNSFLVASLASGGAGFHLDAIQERKFISKFGETIYEDILHISPTANTSIADNTFARSLAVWSLQQASGNVEGQVKEETIHAISSSHNVNKSPLFNAPTVLYAREHTRKEALSVEKEKITVIKYPTPHIEKLKAILESEKLPPHDKAQVEKTITHYEEWIATMEAIMASNGNSTQKLQRMVDALNQYRIHIDIDLVFDSQEDWLYREKGQIKLDNSVIEEFLPRLVYTCLASEIAQTNASVGPVNAFSSIWFDSSLMKQGKGGGLNIRTKDQDFALSRPLYLQASHTLDFKNAVTKTTNLAYVAAECKTNLDKTMFQEACATAGDLKAAIPGAKYFLLCEWLDMPPISSDITPIDKVYILRKAKRINASVRGKFRTFKGRQNSRQFFLDFLHEHPFQADIFALFLEELRHLLENEALDEKTALERGYF